jgi:hypothetical protein
VRPPRFSGELFKLSFLPKGGGGAVRTSSRGELDEIEHDGDSLRRMRRGGVVGFRGFGLDRYLTITSEGRETWAAGSLRGFVVWVCLARAERVQAMGSEETTDGHVSKFIALLRQRSGTSRDGLDCGLRRRMCLELVKNDWGL